MIVEISYEIVKYAEQIGLAVQTDSKDYEGSHGTTITRHAYIINIPTMEILVDLLRAATENQGWHDGLRLTWDTGELEHTERLCIQEYNIEYRS